MDFQPRARRAILAATAAFGVVQVATGLLPLPIAVALIVLGPIIALGLQRDRFAHVIQTALDDSTTRRLDPPSHRLTAPLLGFLFLAASLVFLEWRQPYYFTEDDNFTMGPVAIATARGLLTTGEWPTWNPYQYMGQPTTVQSMYGLTYPFTYLAFAAVHWVGKDAAYVELFVLLHVLAGYWAMYWAARTLRVRPWLAAAASLSFILSGSALMLSRVYATMAPLLVWTPLLIVAAETLKPRWKWAVLTAIVIGVFCHSGNGQMWFYAVMFFGVALLLFMTRRTVPWIVVAALFSLAISLLLIVPQMWFMRSVHDDAATAFGIGSAWIAMLLPTPLTSFSHPQGYFISNEQMTPYYFAGGVLTLCTIVALIVLPTLALHGRRLATAGRIVRQNAWLLCAGIALWMAFGRDALLWKAMAKVPVIDRFAGPWKMVIFFHLFSAIAAAVIVERLLSKFGTRRGEAVLLVAMLALTTYGVWTTRGAFTNYGDRPYPELPADMAALLKADPQPSTAGRVMSVVSPYFQEAGYVESLARNFASYYGLSNAMGYDRFVHATLQNRRQLVRWERDYLAGSRAYGVRWLILHRSALAWYRWREPYVWHPLLDRFYTRMIDQVAPHAVLRLRRKDLVMWEIPDPDPLAFVAADRRALPLALSQTGVTVDVRSARGAVVVNYLNRPGLHARVDGAVVGHAEDRWGRIVVQLPAHARTLEVRYSPPWGTAAVASVVTLLAGIAAALVAKKL